MRQFTFAFLLLVLFAGCTSRYRMDFFLTESGKRTKVKVLERQFIVKSQLNDPYAEEKVVVGNGNTVLVTVNMRGERHAAEYGAVLGYDENLRYRLYVEVDDRPQKGTIPLPENSLVYLVGKYDLSDSVKTYLPLSGQMVVDSVTKGYLYAAVQGSFANKAGEKLDLDGRVKVKIAR